MIIYTEIMSDDEKFKFSSLLCEDGRTYDMPSLTIKNGDKEDYIDNPNWLWKLYEELQDGLIEGEHITELEEAFVKCSLNYKEYTNYLLIISNILTTAVYMKLLTKEQFIEQIK